MDKQLFWKIGDTLCEDKKKGNAHQKLIIILLDGFRHDYAFRNCTPTLTKLISEGVSAKYVQPIFPSTSWPSYTTIVTGLWPEVHGILDNYFYDARRSLKIWMDVSDNDCENDHKRDPELWADHVPLWTTATEQGLE